MSFEANLKSQTQLKANHKLNHKIIHMAKMNFIRGPSKSIYALNMPNL